MNVYQKINEVRKKVEYVKKQKAVESYKAVTHDQITALTRDHFVELGIVIVPNVLRSAVKDTGTTTSKGTPFVRLEVTYRFDVVNADEPSDRFSADIEAHAIDHGDKAPGKALSYAKKALILKLLEIESGEEDEERPDQHKPKHQSVAKDTWDSMTREQKSRLTDISVIVLDHMREGNDQLAFEYYEEQKAKLDPDEQVALWSRFDSKQRNTLKTLAEAWKKAEAQRKERQAAH